MKKHVAVFKIVLLGVLLALGLQYASADWTPPQSTAPGCTAGDPGCDPPVNVGTVAQVKNGSLSVNAFIANMNALFKQDVTVTQLAAPTATPRSVCSDQTGKLVGCGQYSGFNDVVLFSMRYTGGTSWVVEKTVVLSTTNPSHLNQQIQITSAEKPGPGHYRIRAYWPPSYYIDSDEIVLATLSTKANTTIKLNMIDYDGNNTIEFRTADDASPNDLSPGDEIKFMVTFPSVNN